MAKKVNKLPVKSRQRKSDDKPVRKKAFPMVGKNDLNKLLEEVAIFQNRASTATGSMGELVKSYVQKKHLHAGAFRFINRLYKIGERDPQALWLFLAHFDDMRTKSGLDRIAKAQGQLLPAIDEDTSDEVNEDNNVVDYPQPREVEERAGDVA
jgi:hypothetical protein